MLTQAYSWSETSGLQICLAFQIVGRGFRVYFRADGEALRKPIHTAGFHGVFGVCDCRTTKRLFWTYNAKRTLKLLDRHRKK